MKSISRLALIRSIKIGAAQALVFSLLFSFMSYSTYQDSTLKEIEDNVRKIFSSIEHEINQSTPLAILKKIQNEGVAELILIDKTNCEILSSTTPVLTGNNCDFLKNESYQETTVTIRNKNLALLYYVEFSKKDFFLSYGKLITQTFVLIFIVSVLALYTFINSYILSPIESVKKRIAAGEDVNFREFNFLTTVMNGLKDEISKNEYRKSYYDAARVILHDIRTPLQHLKHQMKSENKQTIESKIDEIIFLANFSLSQLKTESSSIVDFENVFSMLKQDFEPRIDIYFNTNLPQINTLIPVPVFKTILSNLINNSIDADSTRVELNSYPLLCGGYEITITDNGKGFAEGIQDKVFSEGFSTKIGGNGIGLSSAAKTLTKHGGTIQIKATSNTGTTISIQLNSNENLKLTEIVLIDDDKFTRLDWEMKSKKAKVKFFSYESPDQFIKNKNKHSLEAKIYIDSILSSTLRGEDCARDIFNFGFENITLCTNLDDIDLKDFPWLKSISKKTYPIAFPTA